MRGITAMVMIVILMCIVASAFQQTISPQHTLSPQPPSLAAPNNEKKHVNFNSTVRVFNAGGCKGDRFNPDLRDCVQRNAQLAASVGGSKKLAEISLHEARAGANYDQTYSS